MIRQRRGFTLLEVMIAIVILAVLSTLTGSTIQRSLQVKSKLQGDIDRESQLRNAYRIFERDVNSAFHFRNLNQEMQDALAQQQQAQAGQNGAAAPPPPNPANPQPPPPKQLTQFIGDEESLHFTSLNHARMMKDARESDQEEVGYYIESCKGRAEDSPSSKCLLRRTAPYIDDDVTKGGSAIVLLENINKFKLRYLGKGKEDWVSMWKTDDRGDAVTKDHFPQAVEITIGTKVKVKDRDKEYEISTVVPLQFPNNRPEKTNAQAPASSTSTTTQ